MLHRAAPALPIYEHSSRVAYLGHPIGHHKRHIGSQFYLHHIVYWARQLSYSRLGLPCRTSDTAAAPLLRQAQPNSLPGAHAGRCSQPRRQPLLPPAPPHQLPSSCSTRSSPSSSSSAPTQPCETRCGRRSAACCRAMPLWTCWQLSSSRLACSRERRGKQYIPLRPKPAALPTPPGHSKISSSRCGMPLRASE